jgi:cytochrome c oxidase subunit 2
MIGEVIAMEPEDYEAWLASGGSLAGGAAAAGPSGEQLFKDFACISCHRNDGVPAPGPSLAGLAGSTVTLADGRTVVADDNYLRESILNSQAKIVAGYPPVMPVFQGMLSEEQVLAIIAYIKAMP